MRREPNTSLSRESRDLVVSMSFGKRKSSSQGKLRKQSHLIRATGRAEQLVKLTVRLSTISSDALYDGQSTSRGMKRKLARNRPSFGSGVNGLSKYIPSGSC